MTTDDPPRRYVFLDRHVPQLAAGGYTLNAKLAVTVAGGNAESSEVDVGFWVGGERFSLDPTVVHSVYPPEGSRGAFGRCLPHIALMRDTLPWERSADGAGAPWLALLLLSADEARQCPLEPLSLHDYRKKYRETRDHEPGQSDADQLQVIHLGDELLKRLIPTSDELHALCHVRGTHVEGEDLKESVAVVVSKHVPREGRNTVHLVSLEDRYAGGRFDAGPGTCTLVSLKSWTFTCEPTATGPDAVSLAELFKGLRNGLGAAWLRIPRPVSDGDAAETYLSRGRVPLPHQFRSGESGVSWYSGPLVPGAAAAANGELVKLPAGSADELLWYDEQVGMLDVSYAAAWELGRLLAFEQREVVGALASWRRQQVLGARHKSYDPADQHLPQIQRASARIATQVAPEALLTWIGNLRKLSGVPFKYLVPDERMLPAESIRFFSVDSSWMGALIDGALSLARPPRRKDSDRPRSDAEAELLSHSAGPPEISGFLLRSSVVSGWPGLEIEASGRDGERISLHHRAQLAPSTAMVLFAGRVTSLVIRQHRSTVHLALKEPGRVIEIPPGTRRSATLAHGLLDHTQQIEIAISWNSS